MTLQDKIEKVIRLPRFYSIEDIKRFDERNGGKFFSPSNMRSFGTRTSETLYGDLGDVFITSEYNYNRTKRVYSLREVRPSGYIWTVGDSGDYATLAQAKRAATAYVNSPAYRLGEHSEPDGTARPELTIEFRYGARVGHDWLAKKES